MNADPFTTESVRAAQTALLRYLDEHADHLVALLQELIRIPSQTGSEAECQARVAALFAAHARVDAWEPDGAWLDAHPAFFARGTSYAGRPDVVAVRRGRGAGRSLILNAHVDVVDPGPPEPWPFPAWSGQRAQEAVWGRGAIDDKAGLALMLFLLEALAETGVQLAGDLILESVVDEEWGGGGTLATLARGYRADGAIVFEPTGLAVCPVARGGQTFQVSVPGRGAHPIRSYEGVSALHHALPLLEALAALEAERQERFRTELFAPYPVFLPIVVGTISAGEFPSKVPERCIFSGLMGYAPEEDYHDARRELEACIADAAGRDPWLAGHPPAVTWLGLNKEGAATPAGHPLVTSLAACVAEGTGRPATVTGFTAGCDLPHLVRYGGMPAVLFGPGDPAIAHTSREHLAVADLLAAGRAAALAVPAWCGVAGEGA